MKIACLAWGSLVWDPRNLKINSPWFKDGPPVQVEFARQSGGGRLTLVLGPQFLAVQSLWAWMGPSVLSDAIESLRSREGTNSSRIGVWYPGEVGPDCIMDLPSWASEKGASGVIWTALPPRFKGQTDRAPTIEEALKYLQSLGPAQQHDAEEYIRNAPPQIRTPYRNAFEANLGWHPEPV